MSTANLSLHLPDETELEAAAGSTSADSTADAAEAIEASEAAAAVEEGDEEEGVDIDDEIASEADGIGLSRLSDLIGIALENGWQATADAKNQVDTILTPPSGHRANVFCAEWKKVRYQGSLFYVPHWIERVLAEDGLLGDAIEEMATDDPEATLLEEPADDIDEQTGSESQGLSIVQCEKCLVFYNNSLPKCPNCFPTPNRLTPHQPPKSAALVALEHRLTEARGYREGAWYEFRKLEAATKAAKERLKDAEDQLFDLLNEAADFEDETIQDAPATLTDAPPSTTQANAATNAHASAAVEGGSESAAGDAVNSPPSNAWRSESILSLNLKTTIADKLIEAGYNTIGKLEDLRADTFAGGLKSIKGIGQAKADAIEDAILNWLSKNRDRAVLAAAGAGANAVEEVAETAEESPAEESPATSTEAADEAASGFAALDQAATDPDWHATIEERSQQIFFRTGDLSSVSPDDCLSQQLQDSRFWESGYEAYNAGHDLVDCGYVPGGERDDWLRGWMSAKLTCEEGWQGPGSEG